MSTEIEILINHQLHSSSVAGDTLISRSKLSSWFNAFRCQRCQSLRSRSLPPGQCCSIHDGPQGNCRTASGSGPC